MSGVTLTRNLACGWRLVIDDAHLEEGAFVGEARILDEHDRVRHDNMVTIDSRGALGFIEALPRDLAHMAGQIGGAIIEWGLDPNTTLSPVIVPPEHIIDLSEGKKLYCRDVRIGEDGHLRATISMRDALDDLLATRQVVFDDGPEEYAFLRLFRFAPPVVFTVEQRLRGLVDAVPAAAASRIVRSGDIALTEPAWLIEGILPRTGLTLLVGKEASYKSFAALSMAGSILAGLPWLGHEAEPGGVLYLAGEGQVGIKRRIRAWEIAHGLSLDELLLLPLPVNFLDAGALATLLADIAVLDPAPSVIIVDTLARYYGGDENATADMGRFVEACDQLKRRTGAQVVIVHHLNKIGEFRGNTALVAAVDTRIDAKRDGNFVTLTCSKQKDWGEFEPLALAAYPVDLDVTDRHGNPVTSLVLQPADADELRAAKRAAAAKQPLSSTEQKALDLLRASGPLIASDWQAATEAQGISRASFFRITRHLVELGLVKHSGERGADYSAAPTTPVLVSSLKVVSLGSHETSPHGSLKSHPP